MNFFILFTLSAAVELRTDNVLAEAAPKEPCRGIMCQFLAAFQEDLGKISHELQTQVMLLQQSSISHTGGLRKKGTPDPKDPVLKGMVGMLGDMYGKMKERIGKANAAEKKQKVDFDNKIAELEAKKAAMKKKGLSDDTYDRIEAYWKKQRNNAHRQYHNLLKLTHAGMSKFEKLMNLGKDAEAGKPLDKEKLKEVAVGVPNVVFIELRDVTKWVHEARAEVDTLLMHGDA